MTPEWLLPGDYCFCVLFFTSSENNDSRLFWPIKSIISNSNSHIIVYLSLLKDFKFILQVFDFVKVFIIFMLKNHFN